MAPTAATDISPDSLEQYRRELTGYCYRMLGSGFEADDAVQETMLRAWRAADGFEGRSSVRSWLYRIATNICLDMLRGRQRRALPIDLGPASPPVEALLGGWHPDDIWISPIADDKVVPEHGDPADIAVARDTIRLAFVTALQHLPARQRATLILCEVLRMPAAEAASTLGTSVAAVNSALQRARATLAGLPEEQRPASVDADQSDARNVNTAANCKLRPAHVPLFLNDTLSATAKAVPEGPIKMYVCGVTPYDTTHLGHAFTFTQFDTLVRTLRWLAPEREVTYIQNVTDIDDSILMRARKLGVDWRSLGDQQTEHYRVDMDRLHIAPPTHLVRATAAIPTMQAIIKTLIEREAAYAVDGGSVFFHVAAAPSYGQLSKLSREQMLEIASQQDDADIDDPRKEDPLDFALWKGWSGQADEPCWESPWGPGRPGWHVECSALCYQFLGPRVTIHGGGVDLVFPHHECEIAQSETAFGVKPFVELWSHVAMVRMHGEKMSKSLGNMVFLHDLLKSYSANAIRLYLLGHHYRQVWEWSPAALDSAAELASSLESASGAPDSPRVSARDALADALSNDLDTPRAISVLTSQSGNTLRELGRVLGLTF